MMLTALGCHSLPQRSALRVPMTLIVFSSIEGLAWRAVVCAAEDRRASSDSAGHANLTWFRDRRQPYHLPKGWMLLCLEFRVLKTGPVSPLPR